MRHRMVLNSRQGGRRGRVKKVSQEASVVPETSATSEPSAALELSVALEPSATLETSAALESSVASKTSVNPPPRRLNPFAPTTPRKVTAFSLDWDGCVGAGATIKELLQNNEDLIQRMTACAVRGEKVVIYIGSNRQSYEFDLQQSNAHGNFPCLEGLKAISLEVKRRARLIIDQPEVDYIPVLTTDIA